MKLKIGFLFLFISITTFAQDINFTEKELTINSHVDGTLLTPNDIKKPHLAIIVAGSGPTNRDGNQNFLNCNSLKKLAEGISNQGIATFRYDKRVVKQIREGNIDKNTTIDDFITDATSIVEFFNSKKEFKHVYVIGHSQGSLVGMLAAKNKADGFISIAGAGQSVDKVLTEQINNTAPMFTEDTKRIFKILGEGKTTTDFPLALASIFNIDLQPFFANWMQYDPQAIIKEMKIPILIINGTKDLQVSEAEANLLKEANSKAELVIIDKMNHVLVPIEGDLLENTKEMLQK